MEKSEPLPSQTEQPAQRRKSPKWRVDVTLFILFVIVSAPGATGIPAHEWLSLIFIPVFVIHLLLNWTWIVKTTTGFFSKLGGERRFNYIWDWLLYFTMVIAIYSGLLISEVALPNLGISVEPNGYWATMHDISSGLLFVLIGVHLALHWKWIKDHLKSSK